MVKALALALHKGPPRVAMCPVCPDEVLVSTLRWSGAEFFCLGCDGHFSFVDPRPEESTPELDERIEKAKAEFDRRFPRP
jgi:hypothetical protein